MPSLTRMLSYLFLTVLFASCMVESGRSAYSFSGSIGGPGPSFVLTGNGRLTGIRVWEVPSAYIAGIQLRFGRIWTRRAGRVYGSVLEIELSDEESIIQVSGKYANYIYKLTFFTSRGRSLSAGQPTTTSFNVYAPGPNSELRMLSGRYNRYGIVSLGAHWSTKYKTNNKTIA